MNDLTKLIFEKLGVEPNEEFKIIGENNKNYFIDKTLMVWYEEYCGKSRVSAYKIRDFISGDVEIIKMPKPLLTEEEKEWLSKFDIKEVKILKKPLKEYFIRIRTTKDKIYDFELDNDIAFTFHKLETNKFYTKEDLGL